MSRSHERRLLPAWLVSHIFFISLFLSPPQFVSGAYECSQKLYEAKGEPAVGSNGFTLEIYPHHPAADSGPDASGKPAAAEEPAAGYVPGKMYRIALRGWRTQYFVQTFRGFGLTATFEKSPTKPAGQFDVKKNRRERGADARVAPNCRAAGVSHTNLRPKTEAKVLWRAPETSTDCVLIRATVIQSRYVWYMNANELTKRFCVVEGYQKVLPKDDPNEKCCACNEADYDVEFIGIWSKDTHPKDYPSLEYLTHFTDMLGASHSANYSMYRYGEIASDGLKEIAEWGNTYKGESEMKAKAAEVRTIVKLKGLWYPEVQGRTSGHFHVNKYHHLASLAAMFGPSPDWCVGVSSINLCLPDCSWVEERAFDLRPFDAGTDNGPTYMSPNNPAEPRHPVAPITTKGDKRSPFYDANADEIPPLARLIIRRKAVQSAQCRREDEYRREAFNISSTSEDEEYKDRRECSARNWQSWSLCSATCGKGIRMRSRVYEFPVKAQMFNCHRQMTERQFCNAKINECEDSEAFNSKCTVNNWAPWSECTVTCGRGERRRERTLQDAQGAAACAHIELSAVEKCTGDGGDDCSVTLNPLCQTTKWSEWSPCSASCDDGVRVRTRLFFYAEHEHECSSVNLMEKETCNVHSCRRLLSAHSEEICLEEKEAGQCGGTFPRYWFDAKRRRCERFVFSGCKGNRNQFDTEDECKAFCMPDEFKHNSAILAGHQILQDVEESVDDGGEPTACQISEWSSWAGCSVTCGKGRRQRNRAIEALPRNGGSMCPPSEQLIHIRSCELRPCPRSSCRPGRWSSWSTCSAASASGGCGEGYQTRRRRVNRYNADDLDDPQCSAPELEQRACRLPCEAR